VEQFAEHAYNEGSKVDGMKIIIENPRARAAFMKFLSNTNIQDQEKYGDRFSFYQDLEKLRGMNETEIANAARDLVDSYKKPSEESEPDIEKPVISNIKKILEGGETGSPSDIMMLLDNAMNEIVVLMAFNSFPQFIKSEMYKEWRQEEANMIKIIGTNSDAIIQPNVPSSVGTLLHGSLAERAALFVEPATVDRVFGSGSWVATFISVAEGLPICVTFADANPKNPCFPLLYVNKVFESTTGFRRERIRGQNCRFLQMEKTEKDSIALLSNALGNQLPVKVALTNFKAPDATTGRRAPFKNLLAMKPVIDLDGKYSYVVGVQFDISAPGSNAKSMRMVDQLLSLLPNVVPTSSQI